MPATNKQRAKYISDKKAGKAGNGAPSAAKVRADKARAALLADAKKPKIDDTPF